MSRRSGVAVTMVAWTTITLSVGCTTAEKEVSFRDDVRPVLEENCASCHTGDAEGMQESGLSMASYEDLMAGTRFGPVVIPGDALSSVLIQVVEGRVDESIRMPHGGEELTEAETAVLRDWVNQGAKNN